MSCLISHFTQRGRLSKQGGYALIILFLATSCSKVTIAEVNENNNLSKNKQYVAFYAKTISKSLPLEAAKGLPVIDFINSELDSCGLPARLSLIAKRVGPSPRLFVFELPVGRYVSLIDSARMHRRSDEVMSFEMQPGSRAFLGEIGISSDGLTVDQAKGLPPSRFKAYQLTQAAKPSRVMCAP